MCVRGDSIQPLLTRFLYVSRGEAAERKAKKRQADADLKSPRKDKDEPKITREAAIAAAEQRAAKVSVE